jgi:hypothetical protein
MAERAQPLLDAVKRLAAPADEQAAYLRRLGSYPALDELALEFDDALAPARCASGGSKAWQDGLRHIDAKLDSMSGEQNASLWDVDALDGSEWAEVRDLARKALAARPR